MSSSLKGNTRGAMRDALSVLVVEEAGTYLPTRAHCTFAVSGYFAQVSASDLRAKARQGPGNIAVYRFWLLAGLGIRGVRAR